MGFMKSTRYASPAPPASVSQDSLVVRTLLATARQRPGLDEARCRFVFEWLRTAWSRASRIPPTAGR
jgi:hypothetical protein